MVFTEKGGKQYRDRAQQLLVEIVDRDAYNFMPSAVAALNERSEGRSAKVVPLKTTGDGNCLPRAISRGSNALLLLCVFCFFLFLWNSELWQKKCGEQSIGILYCVNGW